MNPTELEQKYRGWSDDDLQRAVTVKRQDYTPEAVTVLEAEMRRRRLTVPATAPAEAPAEPVPAPAPGGSAPSERISRLPETKRLYDYLFHAPGIGRKGLNIMCFIGVFIFGWLLASAFDMLGKKVLGWFYFVPIILGLIFAQQEEPVFWFITPVFYVIGWIHANLILTGYQSIARRRIAEIDQQSCGQPTTDEVLEKGIIQSKVFGQKEIARVTFQSALQMPGGGPGLLNVAGVRLFGDKRYAEAKPFFERALASADGQLKTQIEKNLANTEKKLRKQR